MSAVIDTKYFKTFGDEIHEAEVAYAETVGSYRRAYYNRKIVLFKIATENKLTMTDDKGKTISDAAAERLARTSEDYGMVVAQECDTEENMIKARAKVDKLKREYDMEMESAHHG